MMNLYWKDVDEIAALEPKSFGSESEFEEYIFENQDILGGDINIIYRQIRTGAKQGIPDMIGVDQDSRICVIEVKNVVADESILPQAMGYAVWADTHPDSLRAIWLESKDKPDIQIDWDKINTRIILIAPDFKSNVINMVPKIGYKVDLFKINRYSYKKTDEFLIVDNIDTRITVKVGRTKVLGEWSWEIYKEEHGKEATQQFKRMVEEIDQLCKKNGWDLPYNLNKYYVGFKLGSRVVFAVHWAGTYAWNLIIKLPEKIANQYSGKHWEYQRYDNSFHEAIYKPLKVELQNLGDLKEYLNKAYANLAGKKSLA